MFKHIQIVPLLSGILVGIVGIIFIKPEMKVIYKYPNPTNADKMIYKDKNGVCYKYSVKEENCDQNEARLKPYPLSL